MARAIEPINQKASTDADNAFYERHPELVRSDGQRIPLEPGDPLAAEWMRLYEEKGGETTDAREAPAKKAGSTTQPCPRRCVAVRYEYADGTGVPDVDFTVRKSGTDEVIANGTTDEYGNGYAKGLPPDATVVSVDFADFDVPYMEFQPRVDTPWPTPEPVVEVPQGVTLKSALETYYYWWKAPFVFIYDVQYGALVGDIEKNPTYGQILGNVVIGFVPYAGQAADARDISANIYWLTEKPDDLSAWVGLTTSTIALVPGAGDVVKGVLKVLLKGVVNDITRRALFRVLNSLGQGSAIKYLDDLATKMVVPYGSEAANLVNRILRKTIRSLKELRASAYFPDSLMGELDAVIRNLEVVFREAEPRILQIMVDCRKKLHDILERDKGLHATGSGRTLSNEEFARLPEDWQKEIELYEAAEKEIKASGVFDGAIEAGVKQDWVDAAELRRAKSVARTEAAGEDYFGDQIIVRQELDEEVLEFVKSGSKAGMASRHLRELEEFAAENEVLCIVRANDSDAIRLYGWDNLEPKPVDVKLKTAKEGQFRDLVVRPENPTEWELKNIAELEAKKYRFDKSGVLRSREGKAFHGDYDIQGIYKRDKEGYGYNQLDTNNPALLGKLNDAVRPGRDVYRHGANDDFMVLGAEGRQVPGRMPGADEKFLVVDETGKSFVIESLEDLRKFYLAEDIPWPYGATPKVRPPKAPEPEVPRPGTRIHGVPSGEHEDAEPRRVAGGSH